ncbi:MAG: LamG-like jellyroll fold domain-containing protein, partial [Acidimicrobiia bacterium]
MDVMGGFFVIAPMVDHGLGRRLVAAFAAFAMMASLVGFAAPAEADDTPLVDAPPINLTLNGVATQSSTYQDTHGAERAIDGNVNGALSSNSVSHTDFDLNAWWQVDLGSVEDIPVVKVFGRTDCCTERLDNFSVFVSDAPFASADLNATRAQAGVSEYSFTNNTLTTVTATVGRTGRYVRVQLHDTDFLHLAEVQVGGPTFEIQPDVIPSWGVRGNTPSLSENIDADIFAIEQIGNILYVGGRFEEAVPTRFAAGVDQPFLMALNATTGDFISTFRPALNGPVLALEASADGSRLFVGGEFYSVNDEPNTGGLVALDPVTGLVQKDWTSHFDRFWAVASAQVKTITIAGGFVYAGGNFTHASDGVGPRTNVFNVARFNLATGRLDTSWRPTVSGGSVWGIAVDETRDRVYLGGKFRTVNGSSRIAFAALTISGATLTGPTSIARNVPSTGQIDIYDVVAVGDLVVIAGAEHNTIVYDADDFSVVNWVFTNSPGGDNQDLEVVGDRIYSTCHCRGGVWDNYRPGSNWTVIAQGTYKGVVEGIYAISAKTGAFLDSFPYDQFEDEWVISAGPWAVHGAPDGCLWIGGDLNLEAIGGSYVNSLARVCLEGGPRPLGLTTPTAPPPDTVAPPAPNAAAVAVSNRTVTVTITAPGSTADVAHYLVLRDGVPAAKTETTSAVIANEPVGDHVYTVVSVDSSGNQSSPVTAGSVKIWAGSYARYVDANFDNLITGQEYQPFAFERGVFGGIKPDRAVGMYAPDGAPVDDGAAVLILGGKVLNGTPPVTDMAGAFTTTFTLTEPTPVSIRFDRRLFTSASMGTLSGQMALNGVVTTFATRSTASFTEPWTETAMSLGTLPAGTHTLSLGGHLSSKGYSFANWWNRIAFDDVLVYSDKPGLEVLDAPAAPVAGTSLPVTIASRDFVTATSALTVRVTPSWTGTQITPTFNATTGLFTTNLSLAGVADGARSYTVTVTDGNGLVTTQIVDFTLQNEAPPTVSVDAPVAGATVNGVFDVVVDAVDGLDPAGSLAVDVSWDGATWVAAVWNAGSGRYVGSLSTVGLPDGAGTIQVRATDSDELTSTSSVNVTVSNAAPAYDAVVIGDGPDAYWRLGESSGTVATEVRNGINGTYSGGVTLGWAGLVAGSDTAARFDGVDDAVLLPDSSFLNLRTRRAQTVEAWFSASGTSAKQVIYEQGGTSRGLNMYVSGGRVYVGAWNTANDPSADTPWASGPAFVSAPITANTTYHVALVYDADGNRVEGFLDGVSFGTVTGVGTLYQAAADSAIGSMIDGARFHDSSNGGNGFRFAGVIDEVAVYNKVLTAGEIAEHHEVGRGDAGTPPAVAFVAPV